MRACLLCLCALWVGAVPSLATAQTPTVEIRADQPALTSMRLTNDDPAGYTGVEWFDGTALAARMTFQNVGHFRFSTEIAGRDIYFSPEGATAFIARRVNGVAGIVPSQIAMGTAPLNDHRAIHIVRSYSDGTPAYNLHMLLQHSGPISAAGIHTQAMRLGTLPADHIVGIQSVSQHSGTGLLNHVYGVFQSLVFSAGSRATNASSFYAARPTNLGGVIDFNYGLFVEDQSGIGAVNFAVFTAGAAPSKFGGVVDGAAFSVNGTSGFTGTCGPSSTLTITGGLVTGCSS